MNADSSAKAENSVRDARASDAADLARIQVSRWQSGYPGLVPDGVLAELTSAEAEERWREHWAGSLVSPPSGRHRVLAAIAAEPDGTRLVTGFAAFGPATDPDRWPGTDAELYVLCVEPGHRGRGHGSRLLNAAVAALAEDGFGTVRTWVLAADSTAQAFLQSAGWAPDGTRSHLDMGTAVAMIRLHTAISPDPDAG
ncbi:MAG TPA: GNAT family N-acetyltransferase [Streptosporangiaceae bacterium]